MMEKPDGKTFSFIKGGLKLAMQTMGHREQEKQTLVMVQIELFDIGFPKHHSATKLLGLLHWRQSLRGGPSALQKQRVPD